MRSLQGCSRRIFGECGERLSGAGTKELSVGQKASMNLD